MTSTTTCQNCRRLNPTGQMHRSNCGARIDFQRVAEDVGNPIGEAAGVVAGLFTGAPLTIALYALGSLFEGIGKPHVPQEFQMSKGSAAFYLLCFPAIVGGIVFMFSKRMQRLTRTTRGFFVATLVVALGGMAACDFFSWNFFISNN